MDTHGAEDDALIIEVRVKERGTGSCIILFEPLGQFSLEAICTSSIGFYYSCA